MTEKTPEKEKADQVYFRINQDIDKGRPETARAQLARLVKLEGRTGRVCDLEGIFATLAGEYKRAEKLFNEALKMEPEKERYQLNLGNLFMQTGNWSGARELFSKIADKSPGYYPALNNLAMALFRMEEDDEAIGVVNRMKSLKPLSPAPWRLEALYHYNRGNYDRALAAADKNIALDPDNPLTYTMMAQIFEKMERLEDQISALQIAVKLAPESPDILLSLALAYGNAERFDLARPLLEKSLKINPDNGTAHKGMALILTLTGEDELAEKHKKTAIALGESF